MIYEIESYDSIISTTNILPIFQYKIWHFAE